MTSKNSCSNGALIRSCLRRSTWSIVLSAIAFLLATFLPTLMQMQNEQQSMALLTNQFHRERQWARALGSVAELLSSSPGTKVVFLVLAVVCGVSAFAYLHNKQKVDFYHALPISRSRFFLVRYVSGILAVLPVYVVVLGLTIACTYGMGFGAAVELKSIAVGSLVHLLFFMLTYTVAVLCTILCGNTIVTLLIGVWALFAPAALVALWSAHCSISWLTYAGTGMAQLAVRVCPCISYFTVNAALQQEYYNVTQSAVPLLLAYMLATVLLLALCVWLYRIRRSERAGMAMAFSPSKLPIKAVMCFTFGLAFALVFYYTGSAAGMAWYWVGAVIGVLLMHWIAEIVFAFDFRALLKKPLHFACILAVTIAALAAVQLDVFGYDRWVPQADAVTAVEINESLSQKEATLVDPANIGAVCELAQTGVQQAAQSKATAPEDGVYQQCYYVEAAFKSQSGGVKTRRYTLPITAETTAQLQTVINSAEFKQKNWGIFRFDSASVDEAAIEVTNQAGESVTVHDRAVVDAIVTSLRAESVARSSAALPVFRLDLGTQRKDEDMTWVSADYSAIVTDEDVQTLALLAQHTTLQPAAISKADISSIQICFRDAESTLAPVDVNDAADREAMLENAISGSAFEIYGSNFRENNLFSEAATLGLENLNELGVDSIEINLDGRNLQYPIGKAPIAILERYREQSIAKSFG